MEISVAGVSCRIGEVEILKDINFRLESGSFAAIVGPNGAGKSTLIKIMLGLLKPDGAEAKILYDGVDVAEVNKSRHWLGYV
ncbi:MAG TPA: ATP-binding cassette domain-containing protein, partial [Candidatus Wallbacteria bacterium]|nr:ATP-binding cassette domain-containing protein [Candidatus Wallbacteria bacterium]